MGDRNGLLMNDLRIGLFFGYLLGEANIRSAERRGTNTAHIQMTLERVALIGTGRGEKEARRGGYVWGIGAWLTRRVYKDELSKKEKGMGSV
jgi:hypothetical protein